LFDDKYSLRYKERIVAGGERRVNDKEEIYAGVASMYGYCENWVFLKITLWL
jgi:hypothetical protein